MAPIIANRDQTRTRPTIYTGTKDGSIDGWLPLIRRFLERVHAKSTKIDKAWAIFDHLENEAGNYIINKPEPERDEPEKVFYLLSSRFGIDGKRMQLRQTSMSRTQQEKEDWMLYLDALERLRTQGFPHEPITTRRFIDGVREIKPKQQLAVVYAAETYLSLRFTTRQLQHHRPTVPKQPYDPRYAMRSRPHPFITGKIVHPTPGQPHGVLPPPQAAQSNKPTGSQNGPPSVKQASQPMSRPRRAPGACFNCGQADTSRENGQRGTKRGTKLEKLLHQMNKEICAKHWTS